MIPLFEVGEPAETPGPEPGSGRREADRCRRCHRPLKDPESLGYHIGPDCRKALGITGRSARLRTHRGRVRGWKPGDEQPGMFDEEELNEEGGADG